MNLQGYLLVLLNLAMIGLLPVVALQRGRLTLRWWITAAPLLVVGIAMLLSWTGVLPANFAGLIRVREAAVVVLVLASTVLMAYTAGSHRVRLSLWHQPEAAPVGIVTSGPYRLVRHPFYVSFHLTLLAGFAAVPGWLTGAAQLFGIAALRITAIGEERRLLQSEFGAGYAEYRQRTGRFVPRITSFGRTRKAVPAG
jgi:protein-S-isoprenylcysteine O-methyltransferase Ste14